MRVLKTPGKYLLRALMLAMLLCASLTSWAADGDVDTSFDTSGGANNSVRAIAVQSDGKVLIGGDFTSVNGTTRNFIARLNTNGTTDTSFDTSVGTNNGVSAIAVQSDGKVLIGGFFTSVNGTTRNRIARLTASPVPVATTGALITEFRLSGTGGSSDEYFEIYNNTTGELNISGWQLQTVDGNGSVVTTIPTPTVMKSRAHYLFAGANYSLNATYAPRDILLAGDAGTISNVRLLNAAGDEVDAINPTPDPSATISIADYAYVRKVSNGSAPGVPQDTNQPSDFVAVTTNGEVIPGASSSGNVVAQLGAPSPHSSTSPVQINVANVTVGKFNSGVAFTASPNQQRYSATNTAGTPDAFGTIRIRRAITNNTGQTITRVRFHIVTITTLNSTGYSNANQADVRLVSTPSDETLTIGTTLEAPPANSTFGGGLNSNTVALNQALLPNTTQNYSFELGVARKGNFLVGFTIEALPAP